MGAVTFFLAVRLRDLLPELHGPMNNQTLWVCTGLFACILLLKIGYRRSHRQKPESHITLQAGFYATVLVLTFLFLDRSIGQNVSRPTVLLFAGMSCAGLIAVDGVAREWHRRSKRRAPHHLVLFGEPRRSQEFADRNLDPRFWRIIEIIPDSGPGPAAIMRLHQVLREQAVDAIVLIPSFFAGDAASALYPKVMELCELTGIRLQIHSDWLNEYRNLYLDHIGNAPVLTYSFSPDLSWPMLIKRAMDVVLAAGLLVLTSPLFLISSILIKLDSPGPVFFKQRRIGLRGHPFTILKFRSMRVSAESEMAQLLRHNDLVGPVFKMERDPRVTRVGLWLRKTSVDELPQLWNVLRGEMSMVGPRPPTSEEVKIYDMQYIRRLIMKPGISGLWQISGRHNIRDFNRWVMLDTQYIHNWSLWLDCKIILRTFWVVVCLTGR